MDLRIIVLLNLLLVYSVCQVCGSSQYFNGQHCAACKLNCICSSQDGCDACMNGYTYDSTYRNCVQCPTNNNNANSNGGVVNVGCASCCSKVKQTQFVCSSCPSLPFVFHVAGQCLLLESCNLINSVGLCTNCTAKYYIANGVCHMCDISCSTCVDSTFCLTCAPSYYWPASNTHYSMCMPCGFGCSTCTSPVLCSQCKSGFRLSGTACVACGSLCLNCTATACIGCTVGSTAINGTCYACNNTVYGGSVGCNACSTHNNLTIHCNPNNCSAPYFYNSTSFKCISCSAQFANSVLCTSAYPLQCLDDYHATLTKRYYLVNNKCVLNINSCKSMLNSNGLCSQCYFGNGIYYHLVNGVCSKCNIKGCARYSSSCACLQCQSGHQFVNSQCIACQNMYCLACQFSVKACEVCAPYYGLSASACVQCLQPACLNCDGDTSRCTLCQQGYYIAKGTCYKCEATCQQCTSSTQCSLCSPDHYLLLGRCKPLPSNCLSVDSNGSCTLCQYGYFILQGICIGCSPTLFNMNQCQNFCPIYYTQLQSQNKFTLTLSLLLIAFLSSLLFD